MRSNMKTMLVAGVAAASLGLGAGVVHAENNSVGVDFASAYVFRGVTFNDGLVAQPYLEAGDLPVTVGVWGNFDIDDYDGALDDGQFSEIDFYAGYDLPLDGPVGVSLGYTEYMYPNSTAEADREFSLGASLDTILGPSVTAYYGVDGGLEESLYVEGGVGHSVDLSEEVALDLGALVGYSSPDVGEDGFSHYSVSAGVSYSYVSASVAYIGQIDDDVLTDDAYDVEVVGMLGVSYGF